MRGPLEARGAAIGAVVAFVAVAGGEMAGTGHGAAATVGVAVATAVAGAAAAAFAFHSPAVTVRAVSRAALRFAEGRLGERVAPTSGATGELTRNFNHMAGRVQDLVATVEADQARLEAVFAAAADAMVAVRADTSVCFLNPAAARLLELEASAVIDRPFIESARDHELDALLRRAVERRTDAETAVITFGPRRQPLRAVAVPIPGGGAWAALLVLNDLTEVQRIDAIRRDFLANVSHELRTPLASIRALVETLDDGAAATSDQPEFLRRIRQQTDRLTDLVNELLDLSRIESGAIELRPEEIDLAALVAEAAALARPQAEAMGVVIDVPLAPGPSVEGDRAALLRVVANLLDNAIKYSRAGGVVRATIADEGGLAALTVQDEGQGIAPQDLPRVFERFYKGDTSRAGRGAGLGLAIVKHLVRSHGGTVEAASAPGQGAAFTVRLPRRFVGARPAALR